MSQPLIEKFAKKITVTPLSHITPWSHLNSNFRYLPHALFYDAVLAPFGYTRVWTWTAELPTSGGLGWAPDPTNPEADEFQVRLAPEAVGHPQGFHLCFKAPNRKTVDEFYRAAMANGGTNDDAPGIRFGSYYAAFLITGSWRLCIRDRMRRRSKFQFFVWKEPY